MADVYSAWKNLLSTAVFQITVVGGSGMDKIADIFTKKFAKIERNPVKPETVFIQRGRHFNRYEESYPVNQGKLVIGFRAGMQNSRDNIHAITVMNDIFGMGTYSKLFMNVREKLSLAYYCWSKLIASKGIVLVEGGIDTDKEKKVSVEVLAQLSDLRNGKTDPEVLESSKRSLKERYTFTTPESICAWYAAQVTEDEIITPESMIEGVEAVTMEQVCAAAKKLSIDSIFMLKAQTEEETEDEN
jgi:predicted Zn-dependent peptidase